MKLKNYQNDTLRKLIYHDKSFLLWARHTGKSGVLYAYIENYVKYNNDHDIIFFGNYQKNCEHNQTEMLKFFSQSNIIIGITKNTIKFINNNALKFHSIGDSYCNDLMYLKPELIIYDELFYEKISSKFEILMNYIYYHNCKCIFTGTKVEFDIIKKIDCKNDYYINIKKKMMNYLNNGQNLYQNIMYLWILICFLINQVDCWIRIVFGMKEKEN
jgi:hypothetical protein